MFTKHKHYEVIVAWAEGKQIQYLSKCGTGWCDTDTPQFYLNCDYRVKPEVKKIKFRNYLWKDNSLFRVDATTSVGIESHRFFVKWLGDWQEVEIEDTERKD